MEPTPKSPGMTNFLEELTGRTSAITTNKCIFGANPGEHSMQFRDKISEDEYRITGQCQSCQDGMEAYYKKMEDAEQCSWGAGGDPANQCCNVATTENDVCDVHEAAYQALMKAMPSDE